MPGFSSRGALAALLAVLALVPSAAGLGLPSSPGPVPLGDPTPYAGNAIRATYTTSVLPTLEGFEVAVDLIVYKMEVPPTGGHSASELRAAPGPLRGLFEAAIRDAIVGEAMTVLPDAKVRLTAFDVAYGVEDGDADPYHPGIAVHAVLLAEFTPAFFGLPAGSTTPPREVARAFLYSGGVYELAKDLEVPAGFDVRQVVGVPTFLELREPGAPAGDRLVFHTDNFDGASPATTHLDFAIGLREGTVPGNVVAGPLVDARFVVDDATPLWKQTVPFLGGDYVGDLDLDIEVNSLDARLFAAYPLPGQVALKTISADLLRIALREGLVQPQDVRAFFDGLIRRSLEESFGPNVRLSLDWTAFGRSLNEPVGGADGATVAPLVVKAHAVLPFTSNKMFVSSSLGRLFGMTVGTTGSFDLKNDGMWDARYTVTYPKGVRVDVHDSAGLTENLKWGDRDGFRVRLGKGTQTTVHVSGRSDLRVDVLGAGLLELGLLGAGVWAAGRRVRKVWPTWPHPHTA